MAQDNPNTIITTIAKQLTNDITVDVNTTDKCICFDTSNQFIGINTINPTEALDIRNGGSAYIAGSITCDGTINADISSNAIITGSIISDTITSNGDISAIGGNIYSNSITTGTITSTGDINNYNNSITTGTIGCSTITSTGDINNYNNSITTGTIGCSTITSTGDITCTGTLDVSFATVTNGITITQQPVLSDLSNNSVITKSQLDLIIHNQVYYENVDLASIISTTPVPFTYINENDLSYSSTTTVDSSFLIVGQHILINYNNPSWEPSNNGVYTVSSESIITRRLDLRSGTDICNSIFVYVSGGNTNKNTGWVLGLAAEIVNPSVQVGRDELYFHQISNFGGSKDYAYTHQANIFTQTNTFDDEVTFHNNVIIIDSEIDSEDAKLIVGPVAGQIIITPDDITPFNNSSANIGKQSNPFLGVYCSKLYVSDISATGAIHGVSLTTTGEISGGAITGTSLTTTGEISGGAITGAILTTSGAITATNGAITATNGNIAGKNLTATGAISGVSLTTTGEISGGAIHGTSLTTTGEISGGAISGVSLTTTGAISGGTSLTVNNDLNIGDTGKISNVPFSSEEGATFITFSHKDCHNDTEYALIQEDNGTTYLNAKSGADLCLRVGNVNQMKITDTEVSVVPEVFYIGSGDGGGIMSGLLGGGNGYFAISQKDYTAFDEVAIMQTNDGRTFVQTSYNHGTDPNKGTIYFRIDGISKMEITNPYVEVLTDFSAGKITATGDITGRNIYTFGGNIDTTQDGSVFQGWRQGGNIIGGSMIRFLQLPSTHTATQPYNTVVDHTTLWSHWPRVTQGTTLHAYGAEGWAPVMIWADSANSTTDAWRLYYHVNNSDRKLKTNIIPFMRKLDVVKKLNPVYFQWIDSCMNDYGFIAQELEVLIPGVITNKKDDDGEITKIYTNETTLRFIPILTKAIQDLDEDKNKEVAALESRITELEVENVTLKTQMTAIELRLTMLENLI